MSDLYLYVFRTIISYKHYTSKQKIKLLQECLDNGVDINDNDSEALFMAIEENDVAIVNFLIDSKINYRARDDDALILSCYSENLLMELFLDLGCNPNCQNNKPLLVCSLYGNITRIKLLIERGANPFLVSDDMFSSYASFSSSDTIISILEYLISIGLSCSGQTNKPIWNAFLYGKNIRTKKFLLDNGANPNATGCLSEKIKNENPSFYNMYYQKFDGACLFELAIFRNDEEDCKLLIDYGADINLHKKRIITALQDRGGMILFFMNNGLEIDYEDRKKLFSI